jgi:hypothetical protein
MFVNAIKEVAQFTRPLQSIVRYYGSNDIVPGLSTLFFVNDHAVAITCKHVAQLILNSNPTNKKYQTFRQEASTLNNDLMHQQNLIALEKKYGYKHETLVQVKNSFMGCVDRFDNITIHLHKTLDLAIIKLEGFNAIKYTSHAKFLKDTSKIEPGKSLCRLGYPFPEFKNFKYVKETDDIQFDNSLQAVVPYFPIEGMVTRNIAENNALSGIEMSTPGLRGQSGGPLFDSDGIIFGMQQSTKHLHLGFDLEEKQILVNGRKKKVNDYAFLHLGQCVRVDVIKAFLKEHQVTFTEV